MILKQIFIGCADVCRIENNGDRYSFLVVGEDGNGMMEVTLSEFKKFLDRIRDVCTGSWSEELRDSYKSMWEFVKQIEK